MPLQEHQAELVDYSGCNYQIHCIALRCHNCSDRRKCCTDAYVVPQALQVGEKMQDYPDYYRQLKTQDGKSMALSSWEGKRSVVLFFYPKVPIRWQHLGHLNVDSGLCPAERPLAIISAQYERPAVTRRFAVASCRQASTRSRLNQATVVVARAPLRVCHVQPNAKRIP